MSTRWYPRRPVVAVLLLLVFPVGLWLLYRAPRPRRSRKAVAAGIFGLLLLANGCAITRLRVYMDGSGNLRVARRKSVPGHLADGGRGQSGATYVFPDVIDANAQWPGFQGAQRDGVVRGRNLALPWPSEGPRLLWKKPVGGGYASFAVYGGAAFTMEQRGRQEVVACYAVSDGREVWTYGYDASFREVLGGDGPRATPAIEAGRVHALGATGVLTTLDASTGNLIWRRNILDDASAGNILWGQSASPLVHEGRVIVAPGGSGASVVAYSAEKGDIVWKSGSNKAGYSSPTIGRLRGVDHLLVFDGQALSAYAPADGKPLWSYPWKTNYNINVAQPLFIDDERVLIGSSYGVGSAMLRISKSENGFAVEKLWSNKKLRPRFTSPLLYEGHIYCLDESVLVCLDLEGTRLWKKPGKRYGHGQPILAGGHVIVLCENGDLALVEAAPDAPREISRVPALEAKTWNCPAMAEGKLLVRNDREMACYDLNAR